VFEVNPLLRRSLGGRVWEYASDFVIATAIIWTLPLLLGLAMALVTLLSR
jgi:hypothetical protein